MRVWTEQPSFRANSNNRFHRCVCVYVFLYRFYFSPFLIKFNCTSFVFAFCFNWMCVSISICFVASMRCSIFTSAHRIKVKRNGWNVVKRLFSTRFTHTIGIFISMFSDSLIDLIEMPACVRMICLHYTFQQSKSNFVSFSFWIFNEQRWMLWKALTKLSYLMALFKLIFHFHFIRLFQSTPPYNGSRLIWHTIDNVRLPWQSILAFSSGFHWIRLCI